MERKATITITTVNGSSKGFVLVRDDGTLCDHINDCTADLGEDVYGDIESAISGEDIVEAGGELTGAVEDADGNEVRWTVRLPGFGLAISVEAGTVDMDPNDGHTYDLRAVAAAYVEACEAGLAEEFPGATVTTRIVTGPGLRGCTVTATEFDVPTHAAEIEADAICRRAFDSIDWTACEVEG